MSLRWITVTCAVLAGCAQPMSSADAGVDALASDAPPPDAPAAGCLAGCAQFNVGISGCGVSNYDCAAFCAESERIGADTGCAAQTSMFWDCFAAAPIGAYCRPGGACMAERATLDACVALAPSTACLRACVLCGDSSYATCAVGCARRDGHAHLMGCDAEYGAYYACRLAGPSCPSCVTETSAFTTCWSHFCNAHRAQCPVSP